MLSLPLGNEIIFMCHFQSAVGEKRNTILIDDENLFLMAWEKCFSRRKYFTDIYC